MKPAVTIGFVLYSPIALPLPHVQRVSAVVAHSNGSTSTRNGMHIVHASTHNHDELTHNGGNSSFFVSGQGTPPT